MNRQDLVWAAAYVQGHRDAMAQREFPHDCKEPLSEAQKDARVRERAGAYATEVAGSLGGES
jgi:hypothetical protein